MRKGFSFIHAADLHLDSPFQGFEQVEGVDIAVKENVLRQLRNCTFDALNNIVQECIEHRVDFLVLAGDVFDLADRGLRAEFRFKHAMERLAAQDIEVFIACGNHDHGEGMKSRVTWPGNVHFFKTGEVECREVTRDGVEIARVCGISYPGRDVYDNYARLFKRHREAPFAIGVLHSNVGGVPEHENYAPCRLEDLINSGMDYWALGHVHTGTVLRNSSPCAVYPGVPQGRSPRETGEKGCYLVEVSENGQVDLSFLTVDSVRWVQINAPIDGMQAEDELLEHLDGELGRIQNEFGQRSAVCRITLTGRGSLHSRLQRGTAVEDMLFELRSRYAGEEGYFFWPESIRCRTGPPVDRETLERSQTMLADLLALGRKAFTDGELRRQLRESIALLENRASPHVLPPGEEELNRLIEEALDMAVDLLWEEDGK